MSGRKTKYLSLSTRYLQGLVQWNKIVSSFRTSLQVISNLLVFVVFYLEAFFAGMWSEEADMCNTGIFFLPNSAMEIGFWGGK